MSTQQVLAEQQQSIRLTSCGQATTTGNVLGTSSLENRQAERQARMARLKAANRASKLSSQSTSFMPVGFRAEIKNLQYDLRNTMLEVSEEKEAVARDLASLRKLEDEGPHNLDIKVCQPAPRSSPCSLTAEQLVAQGCKSTAVQLLPC